MKEKCYISGKVTGLPEEEYRANFRKAEIAVAILGYEPLNPVEVLAELAEDIFDEGNPPSWEWFMHNAIFCMMKCKTLYVLPDWQDSRGAKIEVQLAKDLNMRIIYQKVLEFKNEMP